ncbi:trehalase family glycosidase, partial [Psychroserpens sp.]|uniref:trehalase family glycosidase n=1 Tax=Psychroserpens sp. TaxID=2020870 RepID=UPI003C765BE3
VEIEKTLEQLLKQEDTDGDKKITVDDKGSKFFKLKSESDEEFSFEGTYQLSNLLQELVFDKSNGETLATIETSHITELPAERTSRLIKNVYWEGLTRRLDASGISNLILDTKNEGLVSEELRIYVPFKDSLALEYYSSLKDSFPIQVVQLPENVSAEYVKSINKAPGILSLKLEQDGDQISGVPFVVPGGRFNEMYGWDSYFESVGLIVDDKTHLAKAMADNFQYEIDYYGKILNANRSYYLTRTQPPFYSSLISEVYQETNDKAWLRSHLATAIKEYETVWMEKGQRLVANGLNRYLAQGIGVPPEVEEGHYDELVQPMAAEKGVSINNYLDQYNKGDIKNESLDNYFVNDRSVRESGHDTSYRIDGNCIDLNLVELNALLYKYETDFANLIKTEFGDSFSIKDKNYTSANWNEKAEKRKALADSLLWNEDKGLYLDYNFKKEQPSDFIAATTLVPLWANMASKEQAEKLVKIALPLLIEQGGIAASNKKSRGEITDDRPQRQWDYPNGWAPHQMMIWKGLQNYGYNKEAEELIYRWLFMITKNAMDYNGTIPEKYDVVDATHKVFAEYGNVGTDFEYITKEGFGWMNASYQYGYALLSEKLREDLNAMVAPSQLFL